MSIVQIINIMRILKIILIVFVIDVVVGIFIFFPIEMRDAETDFFIVLPGIIIANILISALLYYFPTGKYKGLGRAFLANTFFAPFLFAFLNFVTNEYYINTPYSKYSFNVNNDRFSLSIDKSFLFQIHNIEKDLETANMSGYAIIRNDSILLIMQGNSCLDNNTNAGLDSIISTIQDTVVLRHDTIWGLGPKPLPVKSIK